MIDIAVQHLHLRGPPDQSAMAAFRIEDALRTEIRDDRLVLVRRVNIGRLPAARHPRALPDRLGSVWRRVLDGAAHGGADHAAHANCVWFADAAEAQMLFVRRLARGQQVDAWYWRLAVPEWRGETADAWITEQIRRSIARGDAGSVLLLVDALAAASALDLFVRAFVALPVDSGQRDGHIAAEGSSAETPAPVCARVDRR